MDACGGGGGSDLGFQYGGDSSLNCASSGMNVNPTSEEVSVMAKCSMPISRPLNVADSFFSTGWDQLVSVNQNEGHFGSSSLVSHAEFSNSQYPVLEHQGAQFSYPSDPSYAGLIPRHLPCFGNGNFSEMVGSFGMPDYPQIANSGCQPNFISNGDGQIHEKTLAKGPQTQECRNSGEEEMGCALTGRRRKRSPDTIPTHHQQENNAGEQQKDPLLDASEAKKEQDEKKLKIEVTEDRNSHGKQAKDNSNSGEAPKENYIHVRARRGQATNSHSLAERVRREKISERMRMLQELVPGCNKITGKAVMLDEIINYVQSLQQQVEFLSMKLATLIPELGSDLERIVSKDALHLHVGGAAALGLGPGVGCSHPYAPGVLQGNLPVVSTAPYPHFPQASLDSDLQTLFHMGFDSTSTMDTLGPNGHLKPEP